MIIKGAGGGVQDSSGVAQGPEAGPAALSEQSFTCGRKLKVTDTSESFSSVF